MAPQRTYPLMSRREVEAMIADGHSLIVLNQFVLKVDAWRGYHPGGDKVILHMVGRDATDEVTVLHSPEARRMMDRYRIGRIQWRWENLVPPIQGGVYVPLPLGDAPEVALTSPSDASSSDASSRAPSPVFEEQQPVRGRKKGDSRPWSDTSLSSSSSSPAVDEVEELPDGMAFLDLLTRREIDLDHATYPPLDDLTQADIVQKYRDLNDRIRAAGLYECNYRAYAVEVARYGLLFALMLLFLRWGWYATSGVLMGMFWHQLVFSAHDAGHMGITHNFHLDTVIGIVIGDFLAGLSLGWWKANHNVHHIITNHPEHDPDIEYLPFLAVTHRYFKSLRSSFYDRVMEYDTAAKVLVRAQHYLFYPILLFGRFNLYRLSLEYLLLRKGPRKGPAWWHPYLELAGHAFFWYWYGYRIVYRSIPTNGGRFAYVMLSHMVTMPLHLQLTLSHFAMSTADLGPRESFPQKMLRTTMDVDCPEWLDFFHGGLQFQAIHHLYPRIPRHNLRRAQALVRDFCRDVDIPYAMLGFVDGNKLVVGKLADVSRQAAILAKCHQQSSTHTH
ncbi:hypothetical protein RB597_001481 [Gaeumannomyces tritici]